MPPQRNSAVLDDEYGLEKASAPAPAGGGVTDDNYGLEPAKPNKEKPAAAKEEPKEPSTWEKLTAPTDPVLETFSSKHPVVGAGLRTLGNIGATVLGMPESIAKSATAPRSTKDEILGDILGPAYEGAIKPIAQGVKDWRETKPTWEQIKGVLPEAVGTGIGTEVGGRLTGELVPPVARGAAKTVGALGDVAKKAGEPFHIGMTGEELLKKGVSPRAQATGWDEAIARPGVQRAIKESHDATPIRTAADLDEAIPAMKDKIWEKKVEPALQRQGPRPVDMKPAADAVRKQITPEVSEFDPNAAKDLGDLADKLERSRDVHSTNGLLKYINGKLESYFSKYPSARRADLMRNPETAGWESARRAIRDQFLDTLETAGEKQIRDARQDYGALETIGKEVERRVNVADRAKPWSLSRIFGWGAAPFTHGITGGLGELAHYLNKPDTLIRRGVQRLNPPEEAPFTAPAAYEQPHIGAERQLSAPATEMHGPTDLGSMSREEMQGNRWVTPKAALPGIQPIQPEFVREIRPEQAGAQKPAIKAMLPPARTTTIPPMVEEPFAREEVRPLAHAGERQPETQLGTAGRGGIRQIVKGELPEGSIGRIGGPGREGPLQKRESVSAPEIEKTAPVEEEPKEVHIKGITAEEKSTPKKEKPTPVEKRFTSEEIADAEGLIASEAGMMTAGDKPGRYFIENPREEGKYLTPQRSQNSAKGQMAGGHWIGIQSMRDKLPFMRENPKLAPTEAIKALRNKDSAAYRNLIEKAVDFNRRTSKPADEVYEHIRNLGMTSPDQELEGIQEGIGGAEPTFNPEEIEGAIGKIGGLGREGALERIEAKELKPFKKPQKYSSK